MARGLSQARLLPLALALRAIASPLFSNGDLVKPKQEPIGSPSFWWKMGISAFFVFLGGAFSGYIFFPRPRWNMLLKFMALQADTRSYGP
jgi:hypothetical protein